MVLDAVHQIQAEQANDLAVRWNCKAGKCGSCSAEVNGNPRLMCMTRLNQLDLVRAGDGRADARFPLIRDLVTDVSWNFRGEEEHQALQAAAAGRADGTWRMAQADVERVQEFRKCIECFLCQDVCHVLRDHRCSTSSSARGISSTRRRSRCTRWTRENRVRDLKDAHGIGYCNITKCCTKVCPEEHHDHRQRHHPVEGARRSISSTIRSPSCSGCCVRVAEPFDGGHHEIRAEDALAGSGARALAKAERYRLLNEPGEAESICLDVLEVEPDNQEALVTLLLALTDQFDEDDSVGRQRRA